MPSIKDCLLAVYNLLKPATVAVIPAIAIPALPLIPLKTLPILPKELPKLLNPLSPLAFPKSFNDLETVFITLVASSTALIVTLTSLSAILSPPFLIKKIGTIH